MPKKKKKKKNIKYVAASVHMVFAFWIHKMAVWGPHYGAFERESIHSRFTVPFPERENRRLAGVADIDRGGFTQIHHRRQNQSLIYTLGFSKSSPRMLSYLRELRNFQPSPSQVIKLLIFHTDSDCNLHIHTNRTATIVHWLRSDASLCQLPLFM